MKDFFNGLSKPAKFAVVAFLVLLLLGILNTAAQAKEWTIAEINNHIDETNFIVGNHCSATLISVETPMLLTNHHCIDMYLKTEERQVIDPDGEIIKKKYEKREDVPVSQRRYKGHQIVSVASYTTTIEAYDRGFDLALLRFRADKLPNTVASKIYSGAPLQRGEVVYAVGNPMLLDASLTMGIISSVNRKLNVGGEEHDYIQMDAGIVGGSSGGALYDADGRLVGVPAAAAPGTIVGLAIPFESIQTFLSNNCYENIWRTPEMSKGGSYIFHRNCMEEKKKEEKK